MTFPERGRSWPASILNKSLWSNTRQDREQLAHLLHLRRLSVEESFYPEAGDDYLIPLHGQLMSYKETSKRLAPLAVSLLPGLLWPIQATRERSTVSSIVSLSDSVLALMSASELEAACHQSTELRMALIRSLSQSLTCTTDALTRLSFVPVPARLAQFLLESRQLRGGHIIVPYKHRQIAALVSTSRETISSTLGKFRDEGWVASERGKIRLLDLGALTWLAEAYE